MYIPGFTKLLEQASQEHTLKNCSLVIDAQNYFYDMYKKSGLSVNFGCESNYFAEFLKKELNKFIEANIKCFFIFKGGSKDVEKRMIKKTNDYYEDYVSTVFVKSICRQVVEEMGFDYVICKLEAKKHCAALANELACPAMSSDIEVGILCKSYINYRTLDYNPAGKEIQCKLLHFDNFLQKYKLTRDKFSIFILVSDLSIYPEEYFAKFLNRFKVQNLPYKRYLEIFKWLSGQSRQQALDEVTKSFQPNEINIILQKEKEIYDALCTPPKLGIPYHYFLNRDQVRIIDGDPQWFEKGIALRYVSLPYINLFTDNVIDGDWEFHDYSEPDALLLSSDIIKYALNLMTNYSKYSFQIYSDNGNVIKVLTEMSDVPKPDYVVKNTVFENGWDGIKQLRLLDHFLKHSVRGAKWELLPELPSDARLLIVALVYMAHLSDRWGERQVYSVLLSFAVLCSNDVDINSHDRDCAIRNLTRNYMTECEVDDNSVIYPMFQFQHCLEHMNYLNALCGFEFKATVYSKTYNGKWVYNVLKKLNESDDDPFKQITQMLASSPTVVSFIKKLADTLKKIMPFKN